MSADVKQPTSEPIFTADGLLLDQFIRDGNQDAFATLMHRHGAYILGVCKHATSHAQDAEDVFQACFLELVRNAPSIRQRNSVVGWLQTVAVRLARKARMRGATRRQRETTHAKPEATAKPDDITLREACRILEEEIAQLPDDLRLPIILCLMQGQTQEEAGQALDINPRTIKERLRRGRERLHDRLVKRGVSLALLGTLLSASAINAAVPPALEQAASQAAIALATKAPLAGFVSPSVLNLTASTSYFGWAGLAAAFAGIIVLASAALLVSEYLIAPPVPQPPEQVPAIAGPPSVQRSFRGKQFDAEFFQWTGPDADQYIRLEDEGLRVTLPAEDGPGDAVGIKLRHQVRGDFEIEATLEFLNVAQPQGPPGIAGASVFVYMNSPDRDGVWLSKVISQERGPVFNVGQRFNQEKQRLNKFTKVEPTDQDIGVSRFRMRRKGGTFNTFVAEGEAAEFRPIHQFEVSGAKLTIVRFAADPVWSKTAAIDVRLLDFTITAEEFVGYVPKKH